MVYIIADGVECVKIGHSKYPRERLKQVQTGHPRSLCLLVQFNVPDSMEKLIHSVCAEYRLEGEWFNMRDRTMRLFVSNLFHLCHLVNFEKWHNRLYPLLTRVESYIRLCMLAAKNGQSVLMFYHCANCSRLMVICGENLDVESTVDHHGAGCRACIASSSDLPFEYVVFRAEMSLLHRSPWDRLLSDLVGGGVREAVSI